MSEREIDPTVEVLARMWAEVDPNRQPIDPDEPLHLPGGSLHGRPTWEWFVPRANGSIAYLKERGYVVEKRDAESI